MSLRENHAANGAAVEFDYTTRDGAERLKAIIEAYWLAKGYPVCVVVHNSGFHSAVRAARYDVRSDLVNGLPDSARRTMRTAA